MFDRGDAEGQPVWQRIRRAIQALRLCTPASPTDVAAKG
jgi:hypothetical protein